MPKTKVETKVETKKTNKRDELVALLAAKAPKLFDREPQGSVQSGQLSQLADEILAL